MYRVSPFVRHFGWALLAGVALASLWVNLDPASYYDAIEFRLADLSLPRWLTPDGEISLTPLSLVSDGLMALFTAFIGKELWEALVLERGALSGRQARAPLGAVAGGALGAMLLWLIVGTLIETAEEGSFAAGWQVPVGSDVVLCYIVGRRVFGPGHPALHLLLLTTIGFDILGLLILGFGQHGLSARLLWLGLPVLAAGAVWWLRGRVPGATERDKRRAMQLWPYVLAGLVSYLGVAASGLPPSLGLLPVIPAIPHADRSFGLFAEAEEFLHDPLNRMAHLLVRPLAVVLFLFGLTRGGIDLAAFAPTTVTMLAALWIGKPLGMVAGLIAAMALAGASLPQGVTGRDLVRIALISAMGFTVPVVALESALPGGAMAEAARLGLALSLLAGLFALIPRRRG